MDRPRPDVRNRHLGVHHLQRQVVAAFSVVALVLGLAGLTALPAAAAAACANLRVSAYAISPVAPVPRQSVFVTVDVQNTGTCAAGAFATQLQSVDLDPLYWQKPTTNSLAAGAVTTVKMGLEHPDAGSFVSTVVVDVDGTVAETNENDNRQVVPITVRPSTVDLVLTGVTLDPVRPAQGRPMTLTVGIRNLGTSAAPAFDVGWGPSLFVSGLVQRVDGLAAGASRSVTFTYTYTSYWKFDSSVGVDQSQEVPETNEPNNYLSFQVPVDPPRPDLVVEGMHLTPSNPQPGEAVSAAFVVKNAGNTDAGPFQLRWQPSAQAQPLSLQAGGLAAGARRTLTFSHTFPTADVFQGPATVDPTGLVKEIEEGNNTTVVTVPVAPFSTNLKVFAYLPDTTVRQARPFHVLVNVSNTANTASGPFDVAWNPDTTGVLGQGDRSLTQHVGSLERGERRTLSFEYTYWQEGAFASAVTVDGDDRVVETIDKDNRQALPVTVAEPDIDLEITGFTLSPASPLKGGMTTATITVTNTGWVAAGPFVVQWKLPASSGVNPRATVRGLPAKESRQLTFGGTFADAGPATTSAVADVFHQVAEPGGEGNNTVSQTVDVRAPG